MKGRGYGLDWLPRFSLRRPVTIYMLLAAVLVLGAVSYTRLPLELMPGGGSRPRIWLRAQYRGATASDMLELILEPTEERLRTIPRLKSITSKAFFEGASISLEFHRQTDLNQAYLQLREKLEQLRPELPEDFERFTVWRWDNSSRPIFWSRITQDGSEGVVDSAVLERVEQAIQRIPGVAKVDLFGQRERELAVLLQAEALESLRVEPAQVVEALRLNNFSMSLGRLESGGQRHLVRAVARLNNMEEVRALHLAPSDQPPSGRPAGGRQLRIEDVALVALQEQEGKNMSKLDGRQAVLMAIYKETSANTVTVGREVRRVIAESFPRDPLLKGARVHFLFADDLVILKSLKSLQQTALWGGLLASLVLLAFLGRLGPTLLVMAAIPLSILMTLIAMFFMGDTINIISLTGLMLALGMLVDNSVVVVENTARLRAAGAGADEAAMGGAGEVSMAILLGTLTTMIVFLPLPFLGQRAFLTFLFRHLSHPIAISLGASLIVAAIFVPLAARSVLGKMELGEPGWFSPLRRGYTALLGLLLRRRLDGVTLLGLLFLTILLPLDQLKWNLFGSVSMRRVRIHFQHSPIFDLAAGEDYFDRLTERFDQRREELGLETILVRYWRGGGRVSLFLDPERRKIVDREAYFDSIKEVIGEEPGVSALIRNSGGDAKERVVTLNLHGARPEMLARLANQVRKRLSEVKGLGEMGFEAEWPPHEVAVVIDRRQAERHGITARAAARRVAAELRGAGSLPRFRLGEEEIEVVVRRDIGNEGLGVLRGLHFRGRDGPVPFDSVAQLHFKGAPEQFRRVDGKISLTLEALLQEGDFTTVQSRISHLMDKMVFPDGYRWSWGRERRELAEDRASLVVVLLLAVAAIFMVMGFLFESFLLPLSVLATVPLALFGSAWLLFLTGTPLDTTGMIGLVILIGVVVNNGIVLVDRINRNRIEGMELDEAIVGAGGVRLRPILMTALTTVFGLLPMVFGFTNVAGFSFVSMGRVVTGGLLAATLLTLFVVPLTYHALARMGEALGEL